MKALGGGDWHWTQIPPLPPTSCFEAYLLSMSVRHGFPSGVPLGHLGSVFAAVLSREYESCLEDSFVRSFRTDRSLYSRAPQVHYLRKVCEVDRRMFNGDHGDCAGTVSWAAYGKPCGQSDASMARLSNSRVVAAGVAHADVPAFR
jgi:hypothetical protein